jgi:septum formation protein
MLEKLKERKIILASQSPRRHYLLKQLGLEFTVIDGEVEENYPEDMAPEEIAVYLAEKKADHFNNCINDDKDILITADTIVSIAGRILGKPVNHQDAERMLRLLSGNTHTVFTGVCIRSKDKTVTFYSTTEVTFKSLSDEEIRYYLDNYKPFDKAGAYGAQEWIGYIAITRIDGSYSNVMGLPIQKLYEELLRF